MFNLYEATDTNGLTLQLRFFGTSSQASPSDNISYEFFAPSNATPVRLYRAYIPAPAYFCTIELRDAQGRAVAKTRVGKEYGSEFNHANLTNIVFEVKRRAASSSVTGSIITANGSGRFGLPSCDELFEVQNHGTYMMVFQFQVVVDIASKERRFLGRKLLRFPPLKVKLEKK